jgi:hypothetical protein
MFLELVSNVGKSVTHFKCAGDVILHSKRIPAAQELPDGVFSKPNLDVGTYLGGPWNGKCWYILWPFEIFYDRLVHRYYGHTIHLVLIWYTYFSTLGNVVPRKIWQGFETRMTLLHKNLTGNTLTLLAPCSHKKQPQN